MRLTLQFCTYKRPQLLARVLEACFEQSVPPDAYEVVLVNDGSPDETPDVIERLRQLARCRFTVVNQTNAGLARARNAGLAQATGERIAFIDDDVLPSPVFVAEHLRSDEQHGDVIVRGAVINTASFDRLPPPIWTPANFSANYFWTSNVSVRRARLNAAGGRFDDSFSEYGWEDIELGMRLRALKTRAIFNSRAVAFHFKPPPEPQDIVARVRQARAQGRTAVQLERKHPHWRVALAVGDTPVQRLFARMFVGRRLRASRFTAGQALGPIGRAALSFQTMQAYYEELLRAREELSHVQVET